VSSCVVGAPKTQPGSFGGQKVQIPVVVVVTVAVVTIVVNTVEVGMGMAGTGAAWSIRT
jgi:hypothetical protein